MPIGPVSACGDPQATSRLALAVDQPTDTLYAAQIPCDESVVADSVLVYDGRHCRGGDLSGCAHPSRRSAPATTRSGWPSTRRPARSTHRCSATAS